MPTRLSKGFICLGKRTRGVKPIPNSLNHLKSFCMSKLLAHFLNSSSSNDFSLLCLNNDFPRVLVQTYYFYHFITSVLQRWRNISYGGRIVQNHFQYVVLRKVFKRSYC